MIRKTTSMLLAVGMIAAFASGEKTIPKSTRETPRGTANRVSGVPEGTGTVQYDPGAPADGLLFEAGPAYWFGNRFDTDNGSPLEFPGVLTRISWYQGDVGSNSAIAVLGGGPFSATLSFSGLFTGVAANAFNSANGSSLPVGSAFFLGMGVYSVGGGPQQYFGSIGLRSATYNGQGFHGIQRDFTGVVSSDLPSQNVMVRVAGDVVVPVELLEFDLE